MPSYYCFLQVAAHVYLFAKQLSQPDEVGEWANFCAVGVDALTEIGVFGIGDWCRVERYNDVIGSMFGVEVQFLFSSCSVALQMLFKKLLIPFVNRLRGCFR